MPKKKKSEAMPRETMSGLLVLGPYALRQDPSIVATARARVSIALEAVALYRALEKSPQPHNATEFSHAWEEYLRGPTKTVVELEGSTDAVLTQLTYLPGLLHLEFDGTIEQWVQWWDQGCPAEDTTSAITEQGARLVFAINQSEPGFGMSMLRWGLVTGLWNTFGITGGLSKGS